MDSFFDDPGKDGVERHGIKVGNNEILNIEMLKFRISDPDETEFVWMQTPVFYASVVCISEIGFRNLNVYLRKIFKQNDRNRTQNESHCR